MSLSVTEYVLWLLPVALQLGILRFMMAKGLQKEFHFFFTYTIFQVLRNVCLLSVFHLAPGFYFYAYWVTAAIGIFLGFAVIYEVFSYVVRPYAGLKELAMLLFRWAALVLLLVSTLLALTSPGTGMERVLREIVQLERSVRLIQCGLLLFVVMFSTHLGMGWKNFAYGIAAGFGIFAATDLALFNARAQLGEEWGAALSLAGSAVYNVCALLWLGYAMIPATDQLRHAPQYQPTLDRWNQAALALVGPRTDVSGFAYISEIEQTVDEVLRQRKPQDGQGS